MCSNLIVLYWRGCGDLVAFIKQSYKLAGRPLEPIFFDWNKNLPEACWDSHKGMGLYHKHDAVLVNLTKIQDAKFAENNVGTWASKRECVSFCTVKDTLVFGSWAVRWHMPTQGMPVT